MTVNSRYLLHTVTGEYVTHLDGTLDDAMDDLAKREGRYRLRSFEHFLGVFDAFDARSYTRLGENMFWVLRRSGFIYCVEGDHFRANGLEGVHHRTERAHVGNSIYRDMTFFDDPISASILRTMGETVYEFETRC